ncbi:MAG: Unknown protein [uncultured Sulfurovum sp.]|uniref:Uncharacterized protein n=1 Tax=uncultured Sulfurovum sp. TaxID=269237 RepID=A0A6S6S8V0_9BACT|nr:MAG: Unknown protein [uncultured Sulfurovum sp.]
MKRKLLMTTLLSMSLLSLNLSAGKMKCSGGYCIVDLSQDSPKVKEPKNQEATRQYETVLIDNIETIVFSPLKYIMTQDEIAEYDLDQMQKDLLLPSSNLDNLPNSDYLCEDDLKPVLVLGIANTYVCT